MLQRVRRLTLTTAALALALPLVSGVGGADAVPWPTGRPPTDVELGALIADALDLLELERFEEYREAEERGEDSGHSTVYQDDIDAGQYTADDLFAFGDAVFGHEFRALDGYAATAELALNQRVHSGVRGGLDTFSCAGCHSVGGPDGAGAATQNAYLRGDGQQLASTVIRNPPHALGLGMVQALAQELSADLQRQRARALQDAADRGESITVALSSKEVEFGQLTAHPNGTVDTDQLDGIDADLTVKPFGWKGTFPTLRRTVEDAARVHFGIQSVPITEGHRDAPRPDLLGPGPDWWDPDQDGIQRELEEGSLTAAAVYLATLEVPIILPPSTASLRDRWARGDAVFDEVGCADCHVRALGLANTVWLEFPDTTEAAPFEVELFNAGEEPKGTSSIKVFSDFKRHDMGPELADPHPDTEHGIPAAVWLTRPLWGLAETAPYLHDGRAATIVDAIVAHGGDAADSRERFEALSPEDRANVHIFLLSLTRAPKVRVPL